ncbi:MAG: alpha/beta hydrolase family protein [Promethearchaeota archaeon]
MKKHVKNRYRYLLWISIISFAISLIFLYTDRFQSYVFYERIQFNSSGTRIHANLFYPNNKVDFQEKSPLIIYTHGLGGQKDLDPRIPNEFTKRGFYVASLDYRGDGESSGSLLDIDITNKIPAIAQECSRLLDVIETLPVYANINSSQIGLIGHSFGGMIALMNGALDNRFKVTVTWAGLVNFSSDFLGINKEDPFMNYIPGKIINETNPSNLLVIQSIYDKTVPFKKNALVAQNLTQCKLIEITEHLIGGPHFLLSDKVLIATINWFELHFFNSTMINGPIHLSYFTTYLLLAISLTALFLLTLAIVSFFSKYFSIKDIDEKMYQTKNKNQLSNYDIIKQIGKITIYFTTYLFTWIIFIRIMGMIGLIFAPIALISLYFIAIFIKYVISAEKIGERLSFYIKERLKDEIKSQFQKNVLAFSLFSTGIFLGLYFSFSFCYPFAFFTPANALSYILTLTIYPFFIVMALFYRKVIYPGLSFLKSPETRTIITSLLAIMNILFLMIVSTKLFIITAAFATYLIILIVNILNSFIYEKTNKLSSVLISSFIIMQLFFGSTVSTILGFGPLVKFLV